MIELSHSSPWTVFPGSFPGAPALGPILSECVQSLCAAEQESLPELRAGLLARARSHRSQEAVVAISVVFDLAAMGWTFVDAGTEVYGRPPDISGLEPAEQKAFVKRGHLLERDTQLRKGASRAFIREMERRRPAAGGWHSIFSLMRDGTELAATLEAALADLDTLAREDALASAIRPYLQVAARGTPCRFTGLDLFDVWRYFRHTWTTTYQSTPGRSMAFLVRDAAAPNHPVIGIAALGSSIVQLRVRDAWIGWTGEEFLRELAGNPSASWAAWLSGEWQALLGEIYHQDFLEEGLLDEGDLESPGPDVSESLRAAAQKARGFHQLFPQRDEHKKAPAGVETQWIARALTHLFRSKRAQALADLLDIRRDLIAAGFTAPRAANLRRALADPRGRHAVTAVLRRVKARRVGVSMMDLTVCGAIAPYGPLLGGKLVSLLMTGAEVTRAYAENYSGAVSVIASSMAGRPVCRKPSLVLLGTTSLYGVAPSQYNRIRMPADAAGGRSGEEIRYQPLGRTGGYGSYHFSEETVREMEVLLARHQRGREVNSIFGEGVNPKFRKVRGALDLIGFPADLLLRHGQERVVYGIPLAANFREVLLGRDSRPRFILPQGGKSAAHISRYWISRWLSSRIERAGVLDAVAQHTLDYPIQHGARVPLPAEGETLELPL